MTLLAIDPGKTIGWALFNALGDELGRGVFNIDKLDEHLAVSRYELGDWGLAFSGTSDWDDRRVIEEIVIENYIGRPGAKNGGQRFWGPECIGRIETYAKLTRTPFHRQRAVDVLKVTALHAGGPRETILPRDALKPPVLRAVHVLDRATEVDRASGLVDRGSRRGCEVAPPCQVRRSCSRLLRVCAPATVDLQGRAPLCLVGRTHLREGRRSVLLEAVRTSTAPC
jgi:hypothetical protein